MHGEHHRVPDIVSLIDDPRLVGICASLLGDDYDFLGGDGNLYANDTSWHSDGWGLRQRYIKLAFYLNPLERATGCLLVIPGSHRAEDSFAKGLEQELRDPAGVFGVDGSDLPCVALPTQPGDVLVFDFKTKHASYGGAGRRRMFTMNACRRYADNDLAELRDVAAGWSRFWVTEPYPREVIETAGPQRMRHLEQLIANFDHVGALAEKAMKTMAEPARG